MSKKSASNKTIRKTARALRPPSQADLERLRDAMAGQIDTSEIPERRRFHRLQRDANGRLPRKADHPVKKQGSRKKAS